MKLGHLLLCVGLIGVLAFAGCWGSKYTLIPPEQAKVDRAYVGDWDAANAKGEHAGLIIRNIDDKQYYVETQDNSQKTARYVGFLAPVKNATFAQLRELSDDGSIPEAWIIIRIELADKKMTLRQLSDDFFKDKTIESAEQLRRVIEENLDNSQMYAQDETITAMRK